MSSDSDIRKRLYWKWEENPYTYACRNTPREQIRGTIYERLDNTRSYLNSRDTFTFREHCRYNSRLDDLRWLIEDRKLTEARYVAFMDGRDPELEHVQKLMQKDEKRKLFLSKLKSYFTREK